MAFIPIFHAQVSEDGTLLQFEASEQALRRGHLKRLAGKAVDVTVRARRNQRSQRQNAWYWGFAIPLIAQELGYDRHEHDRLHYALLDKCFGTTYDARLKQHVLNVLHSADLSTTQFSEFMEWIVRFAAQELGVRVPLPNESEAA